MALDSAGRDGSPGYERAHSKDGGSMIAYKENPLLLEDKMMRNKSPEDPNPGPEDDQQYVFED